MFLVAKEMNWMKDGKVGVTQMILMNIPLVAQPILINFQRTSYCL